MIITRQRSDKVKNESLCMIVTRLVGRDMVQLKLYLCTHDCH